MTIDLSQIDPDAVKVVQRLRRFGHEAYLVGGCVRDLLLGKKPKDFDVSTSATPPELRRTFRNCRIIGRRFRLAHIFFGPKIFETSTFRAPPREGEDDDKIAAEGVSEDLLIRRDNVFGTAEQDAQRRDFTINGLFLDPESGQVTDYVNGMADIEARLVRTIGDPDIRFREDPIRILRAVKFAARCELSIEPETLRRMVEHAQEISKCAQARVSEEFFRLLRAGAAHRSTELLVELNLLPVLMPALDEWRRGKSVPTKPGSRAAATLAEDEPDDYDSVGDDAGASEGDAKVDSAGPATEAGPVDPQRLWTYLAALDKTTATSEGSPSNAVVIASLLMPWLYQALAPGSGMRDVGHMVSHGLRPFIEQLRISRRDAENTRQLLLMMRHFIPSKQPQRRRPPRISNRDLATDLTWLVKVVATAEALEMEALPVIEAPVAAVPVVASSPDTPLPRLAPRARGAGDLPPIPTLPPELVGAIVRPAYLGNGTFGRAISSSSRYAD
ncbi:MAG: polynucleotide adenylyltransferase PcnB [Deltaproteobacteria bacterium]|nr:polynucleotide adenylyltransferase PcnB [Deltaproteobacteria bacterium]